MIEYYIYDPYDNIYLGRNFCGGDKPLYAIGFESVEAAMTHIFQHLAGYMANYSFGELQIVKAFGQRRLIVIKNGREYTGDEPFGHATHTCYETVERVE